MAIPNPNPNIRDYEQSDAYTWSSNKIKSTISSAAELPEVSESDNGEVLGVVEGSWAKMSIPEPNLDPVVIVYKSTPDYPEYFDGMTGAEKIEAIRSLAKSGRLILKEANNSSDYYTVADSNENLNEIRFVKIEDDDVTIKTITYSGASLSGETSHYSSLPEDFIVTFTQDAGNVLTSDKTETEIYNAYTAGKHVVGLLPFGSMSTSLRMELVTISYSSQYSAVMNIGFIGIKSADNSKITTYIVGYENHEFHWGTIDATF